jgi:uncharacterized protein (TIGR03435 family)
VHYCVGSYRHFTPIARAARAGILCGCIDQTEQVSRQLAGILAAQINTLVIDKVGLSGKFDFSLRWTPAPNEGNCASAGASDVSPADPAGPSLFSAIQDQLGLKLESSKGPVDVLVIDKIEKPSQN